MMLPLVIADQVQKGLEGFLRTTFPPSHESFNHILDPLFDGGDEGLFKGPYISMGLPFRGGTRDEDDGLTIRPPYPPYRHQQNSWRRLSGENPQSTLVATGTGSGKTECFLFPVLDHCYHHSGEQGIKTIIIYPMNALATDQAKRLAKTIYQDSRLKDYVTAGLFIGDDGSAKKQKTMQKDMIITDRDTLLENPPDILLTNYKMLDLLLLRKKYFSLFAKNSPSSLKYLVVDEVHTFDGAQGSDLACLFRRLKHRLHIPEDHLCCVGTSATVGKNKKELLDYGYNIFGESFDGRDSIVMEDYISVEEFLFTAENSSYIPELSRFDALSYQNYSRPRDYLEQCLALWSPQDSIDLTTEQGPLDLGEVLRNNPVFQWMVSKYRKSTFSLQDLFEGYREWMNLGSGDSVALEQFFLSLFSLISAAKRTDDSGRAVPFLRLRIQLWSRELRRMVAPVSRSPRITFSDDYSAEEREEKKVLPVIHCRDCGAMGWVSYRTQTQMNHRFQDELSDIYSHFFNGSANTFFLFLNKAADQSQSFGGEAKICASCLNEISFGETQCPSCGEKDPEKLIPVEIHRPTKTNEKTGRVYGSHDCPFCSGTNSLTIVGSRSASMNSVALSQVFASPFNDDKKVIAFSDSVQDASHRAGFFSARTYQFNLRMALQQLLSQKDVIRFPELISEFKRHYRELLGKEGYFASFQAPRLGWIAEVDRIINSTGDVASQDLDKALSLVDRGIYWDISTEIGHRSGIGRTLEKSASLAVFHNRKALESSVRKAYENIKEKLGSGDKIDLESVRFFVQGFLLRLRQRGGVINAFTLPYIKNDGNAFLLGGVKDSPDHLVVPHGRNIKQPAFFTPRATIERFDSIPRNHLKEQNWYALWARKLFSVIPNVDDYLSDLYHEMIRALLSGNLLEEMTTKRGEAVWGIPEDQLLLSSETLVLNCSHPECGRSITIHKDDLEFWENMDCDGRYCSGKFVMGDEPSSMDYYHKLYSQGTIKKIIPREHTGLLTREEREKVENEFIGSDKPWAPNVLSATPTLEMGIDIGDLSSAFLCSVPPNVANYLQRIGRAGRTDGNSFLFTTAIGKPHDNYFYTNPLEMLQGDVETPGLYLDAPRVLERQFFAFSLDSWLLEEENDLPESVKNGLKIIEENSTTQFPFQFFSFIESHGKALLDDFYQYFDALITERVKDYLMEFISTGERTLQRLLIDALHEELNERKSLEERDGQLTRGISSLESMATRSKVEEDKLHELRKESSAIKGFISQINRKPFIQFLTDQGLLPNYMFPETGITLKSVILKERSMEDKLAGKKRETKEFEYVRPSSAALSELAPENVFYAGGYKAVIDQVDLSSTKAEEWQLCPACQHSERKALGDQVCCPRCGSPAWGDTSSHKMMIPLKQVTATTQERVGMIRDDSDDRTQIFYARQMLIDIPPHQQITAYTFTSKESAFGFELIPKVDIRELNFGQEDKTKSLTRIGGMDIYASGFDICRECGKVQSAKDPEGNHAYYCSMRDNPNPDILNGIYLYRDFSSEALRILLPFKVTSNEKNHQSFIAAMFLGLQEFWQGKIDHIKSTVMTEPSREGGPDKHFLVFYDSIPGGTGYLRQLLENEASLISVMEKSLARMKACDCDDGCYRCVFAYRQQRNLKDISKQHAIEILEDILSLSDSLSRIDSLSLVRMEDYFESELEARFIEAIRRIKDSDGKETVLKKHFVTQYNRPGYRFHIRDKVYYIVPQVSISGLGDGQLSCRPDFLLVPEDESVKRIAVFTDGFQYHGTSENNRIADDLYKRMALLQSDKYQVWTFSWNDIDMVINPDHVEHVNLINPNQKLWETSLKRYELIKDFSKLTQPLKSFDLFIRYLELPEADRWRRLTASFGLSLAEAPVLFTPDKRNALAAEYPVMSTFWYPEMSEDNPHLCMELKNDCLDVRFFFNKKGVSEFVLDDFRIICCIDDMRSIEDEELFKPQWNSFWTICNLFQFLNMPFFASRAGLEREQYVSWTLPDQGGPSDTPLDDVIEELFDPQIISYVRQRYGTENVVPAVGFEVLDASGAVIAIAEVAWNEQKECIVLDDSSKTYFQTKGWTVIDLEDIHE